MKFIVLPPIKEDMRIIFKSPLTLEVILPMKCLFLKTHFRNSLHAQLFYRQKSLKVNEPLKTQLFVVSETLKVARSGGGNLEKIEKKNGKIHLTFLFTSQTELFDSFIEIARKAP